MRMDLPAPFDLYVSCEDLWVSNLCLGASPVAQLVKTPPAMQETPVRFLGQEDSQEKGEAIHSSIPRLPWWLRR